MKDALQIVKEIRKTPQYKYHILIIAKLTDFNMCTGHDFSSDLICHHFKISHKEYSDILAGSRKISPCKCKKVFKYISKQVNFVKDNNK